jgi:hypothetical protein
MKIEPATEAEIHAVALAMRERDFEEISAVSFADTREELAASFAAQLKNRKDILCASWDGEPVCVGGFIEIRPRTISLALFATDDFPKIALGLTRFIRNQMIPRLVEAGVHRIEALSLAGYDGVHAWLRTVGLVQETGPLLNFGKNGETFLQFAKVIDVR